MLRKACWIVCEIILVSNKLPLKELLVGETAGAVGANSDRPGVGLGETLGCLGCAVELQLFAGLDLRGISRKLESTIKK